MVVCRASRLCSQVTSWRCNRCPSWVVQRQVLGFFRREWGSRCRNVYSDERYQILLQSKLLVTALIMWFLRGQRQTTLQWNVLGRHLCREHL